MLLGSDEASRRVARRRQREQERVGLAVDELDANATPGLVGVVVDQGETLEGGLLRAEQQPVRGAKERRFGDVPDASRWIRLAA